MKSVLSTIVFFLILVIQVNSQEVSDHFRHKNAIKINPFVLGNAEFQLTYERYFNERNSSLSIIPSLILQDNAGETKDGFQIMSQYKFYLTHLRKDQKSTFLNMYNIGFYAGLYGLYVDYKEVYKRSFYNSSTFMNEFIEFEKEVSAYEGGTMIGLQLDITSRIIIDFYVGGGIRKADVKDTFEETQVDNGYRQSYNVLDREYSGVKPKVGLQLGITF